METGKLSKDCPQTFFAHVNRNKRLTARILQLRHPSGSLVNSDQGMAELLKTTFLGFFREDEGSTPVLQPRTQTNMADPLITELEIRRALDGLNHHKGTGPDGLFLKVLKAFYSHIAPVLARMFNLSFQTAQVPEDWRRAIVTPVAQNPAQQTQGPSDPSASRLSFAQSLIRSSNKTYCLTYPNFRY